MSLASQTEQNERTLAPFATAEGAEPTRQLTNLQTSSLLLEGGAMERIFKFAEVMANGAIATPVHLRGNPADCLAVVMQATQWGMNPFAVAQKTHVINGALGYEAQLVNAVVQSSGAIRGEFEYEFRGEKPRTECRVGAVLRGKAGITWGEWLSEADVTVKNSPLWKTNVKQQLGYLQVKNWARLYTPGAILGVYTPDEFDAEPEPRNMGTAHVVGNTTAAANESVHPKLAAADKAAAAGVAAYSKFFSDLTKQERMQLAPGHEARKARAVEADASRTIDNDAAPTSQPASAPAAAATGGAPAFTFASVMDRLIAAHAKKDGAALDIAADLIGAVENDQHRTELGEAYERMAAEIAK